MGRYFRAFFKDFLRIQSLFGAGMRTRIFVVLLLIVLQSLLELGFILMLTYMGMALGDSDALRQAPIFSALFTLFPPLSQWAVYKHYLLLISGCLVIIASLLKNFTNYYTTRSIIGLGEDISLAISREILERFLYRDYAWHLATDSTLMYQRMLWRNSVATILVNMLSMYACVVTVVILFVNLVGQEPELTIFVMGAVGAVGYVLYNTIRNSVDQNAQENMQSNMEETKTLLCATKGVREVLIYRQQPTFLEAMTRAVLRGRQPRIFLHVSSTMPTWILEATGFVVVVLVIAYMVLVEQASTGRLTTALALLMLTAWRVLPYANRVVNHQVVIRSMRPTADAVVELLESLRNSPSNPPPAPARDFRFDEDVSLHDVYFRYTASHEDSLTGISLTLVKGSKTGIIGPSGSGKSTLAGVLCGLLTPTSGHMTVDGKELTPERTVAYAGTIGYVPQAPFLFSGTLAENVAFSNWGKPWDPAKVRLACRKASIDFVEKHPKGIELPIGENGSGVSGGQAQRISIARAVYTEPQLLIFDEATSALDQANEDSIQQTIGELAQEVTCVLVAHRLSTVQHCDTIIWIDKGSIVMQGPPEEVIPLYRQSHQRNL